MDLLLDTHILLWLIDGNKKMPPKAKELILNSENQLYISSVTLMEISIKHKKNEKLMPNSGSDIYNLCLKNDIWIIPLKAKHIVSLESLKIKKDEYVNNDPFDRMLIAQAKHEKFKLLTHDEIMKHYDEDCILFV